jgi:carbon-monoxide dehydrogenase medium subunit
MLDFDFLQPNSVDEAGRMLADLGEECRVIAGGTALMLGMRQRMLAPTHLVSLGRLTTLRGVGLDEHGGLRIGALTRHAEVARSDLVRERWPMLASMAARLANPQVRNQGTLGGNLCYGDPSTDPPACLLALDAQVVLSGPRGQRELSMAAFLVDYYTTALASDELLTEIRVPALPADAQGHYARYLRTAAEHRPLVNVALLVRRKGSVCTEARLAVGASTPIATRVPRAEAFLVGKTVTLEVAAQAAALVATDIEPVSDARGDADFRRTVVEVVARRNIADLFGLSEE